MNDSFVTIIMAGGLGKRMKSDLPKVLHPINDKPMVLHVIDVARSIGSDRVILVVGYKRELVREVTADYGVEWAVQEQQLGTGDAVKSSFPLLTDYQGDVLVLSGDVPFLRAESIDRARKIHRNYDSSATVFTFMPDSPKGYGRIVRGDESALLKIVEEKDATGEEKRIAEVNGGVYFFSMDSLRQSLDNVTNDNASGEYYLTDTIVILRGWGKRVSAFLVEDGLELAGVNRREQLAELEYKMSNRRNAKSLIQR